MTAIVVTLALKGVNEQGRKHPLDTPKSVIERREREGEKGRRRDTYREGGRDNREVKGIER